MSSKIVRVLAALNLLVCAVLFPFLGLRLLYGLAGSNPQDNLVMALGYVLVIATSVFCLFKPKSYIMIVLSYALFWFGAFQDNKFWKKHNQDLCKQLRSNPTCIESETGFSCTNFHGGGFVTSKSICN